MKKILYNSDWEYAHASYEFLSTPTEPFTKIDLPHDALIHEARVPDLPGGKNTGFYPYGVYEYRKKFRYEDEWTGKKVSLLFEGVYAGAKVYINHQYAGGCMNGYIPFTVEMSPFLHTGENEISVICRTYRDSRWYAGAGIYRNVWLMLSDPVHFVWGKNYVATKEVSEDGAVLEANFLLKNGSSGTVPLHLHLTVFDRRGKEIARIIRTVTLFPGEERSCRQRLVVENPDLWSPDTPDLYTMRAELQDIPDLYPQKAELQETLRLETGNGGAVPAADCEGSLRDTETFSFGIRTLSLSKTGGLKLNGKSIKLRGTCIHHDNGILGSCAYAASAYRRLLRLREAGINAVRIAHHPAGNEILEACDRLGILVMNEGFDAWNVCKNPYDFGLHFQDEWETVIDRMVETSRNHPSVILYSLGNEIIECGNPQGAQTAWKLNERIKALDLERFTIICLNVLLCMMDMRESAEESASKDVNEAMAKEQHVFKSMITSREVARRVEEAMGYADIVGYNYGDSRYLLDEKEYLDRILCGSETFSEDLFSNWQLVEARPQILGDFNWTGWDYIGENGIGMVEYAENGTAPGFWRLAYCGDFDLVGTRRAQSYYREAVWRQAAHPWILVQDPRHFGKPAEKTPWSFFDGMPFWDYPEMEGHMCKVQVYADADEVELFLNGKSLGRKAAGQAAGFVTKYEVPYECGELTAVAYRGGAESARWSLRSGEGHTSVSVHEEKPEAAESYLRECGESVRYFLIENKYENGVTDIHTPVTVRVEVKGGELLALGNADPKGSRSFDDSECELFCGQALAAIRGGEEVEVIVRVPCGCLTVRPEGRFT